MNFSAALWSYSFAEQDNVLYLRINIFLSLRRNVFEALKWSISIFLSCFLQDYLNISFDIDIFDFLSLFISSKTFEYNWLVLTLYGILFSFHQLHVQSVLLNFLISELLLSLMCCFRLRAYDMIFYPLRVRMQFFHGF